MPLNYTPEILKKRTWTYWELMSVVERLQAASVVVDGQIWIRGAQDYEPTDRDLLTAKFRTKEVTVREQNKPTGLWARFKHWLKDKPHVYFRTMRDLQQTFYNIHSLNESFPPLLQEGGAIRGMMLTTDPERHPVVNLQVDIERCDYGLRHGKPFFYLVARDKYRQDSNYHGLRAVGKEYDLRIEINCEGRPECFEAMLGLERTPKGELLPALQPAFARR